MPVLLSAMLTALFGEDSGIPNAVWWVIAILAILALLIFILGRGRWR